MHDLSIITADLPAPSITLVRHDDDWTAVVDPRVPPDDVAADLRSLADTLAHHHAGGLP